MMTTMLKPALSALLLIVFIALLLLSSRKAKKRSAGAAELTMALPTWMPPRELSAGESNTVEMPAIQLARPDDTVSQLVSRSPDDVATVLRGMLTQR
jgi:flagellar biosynthesis/type III secretory pathway M-ring protein FliF/YscJ